MESYLNHKEQALIDTFIKEIELYQMQEILMTHLYQETIQYAAAQGATQEDLSAIKDRHEQNLCDLKKRALETQKRSLIIRIRALQRHSGDNYSLNLKDEDGKEIKI